MAGIREPFLTVPGFSWLGKNIGIKDDRLDFGAAYSQVICQAAAVFTRNNFPGAPVLVGREHAADGHLQAVIVNSKNANVATGHSGLADSRRICFLGGEALGITPDLVLPSSTGVIGVRLPMEKIEAAFSGLAGELNPDRAGLEAFAKAIMTTDTRPKGCSVRIGSATLTGIAKGAGMIEPNMATMLSYFFTDARLPPGALQPMLQRAVERSFNRISVDTDTSTSDTVLVLANGMAGGVDADDFESALCESALYLAQEIARDGEGATKLIQVTVCEAASTRAALAIAKSIVNSPLVKTAIHGADPNWGRFIMAIGKVFEFPVPLENLRIEFGSAPRALSISAASQPERVLREIGSYLKGDEVKIRVFLGQGRMEETVWGCDLSEGYIRENADYTT